MGNTISRWINAVCSLTLNNQTPIDEQVLRSLGIPVNATAHFSSDENPRSHCYVQAFVEWWQEYKAEKNPTISKPLSFDRALGSLMANGRQRNAFLGAITLMQEGVLDRQCGLERHEGFSWAHFLARSGNEPDAQASGPRQETISLRERFVELKKIGLDFNEADRYGNTPLEYAIRVDNHSAQRALSALNASAGHFY